MSNRGTTPVESGPRLTASTPAQTSVGTTAGTLLASNLVRRGLIIQNTGTTVIYVVLGTSTPTSSVYTLALKACSGANTGDGGAYLDDSWVGPVQAISSAPGGTCTVTEIS